MKQAYSWLLIATLLALLVPSAALAEGDGEFSSSVEVGAAGMAVDDEVNKVNEYNATRDDDGVNPYVKAKLAGSNNGAHVEVDAEVMGEDAMDIDLDVDANRIFRFDASYDRFNHWLSHDQLNYMDATMKTQAATNPASANPAVYGEDLVPGKDFFIIHKELEMEGKIVIPDLPNVTINAGFRQEEREGVEQTFGISHCSSCHVEGTAKSIDETTTDVTLGATGKFGMLTVDYEYLTREFENNASGLSRDYLLSGKPFPNFYNTAGGLGDFATGRLLYDQQNGDLPYSDTPESEKDSHTIKARLDLSNQSVISAGYVSADIESSKQDDDGRTLADNKLETEYDSYNLRASTRMGAWRLSGYGRHEEIDASDNTIFFTYADGGAVPTTADKATYESEEARDINTIGGNIVYRINSGTSVRFGYEYEEVDREIDDAHDTDTHTVKASARFRPSGNLNGRVSYTYQNIDDQFNNPHGNMGPESQDIWAGGSFTSGIAKRWYGTDFYTLRQAEATNLPEDIHELKASATWTPGPNYSVTVYARYRMEENDLNMNTFEQDTFSPGVNVWWAPINNLNMTMAYNFNKMETENQMCVGWYHG